MLNKERLEARRAIESLRLGVPTATSVMALPPDQPEIISRLWSLLRGQLITDSNGLLIEGDFGSGKSHLLTYLVAEARDAGFATSYVAISKETPLARLDVLYKAAILSLQYPGNRIGGSLRPALDALNEKGPNYKALLGRLAAHSTTLAASVETYEKSLSNSEVLQFIVDFWDGAPLSMPDFKRYARGHVENYRDLRKPNAHEMLVLRFSSAFDLLRASGAKGWLIVLDELELIATFGISVRMRSYGALGLLFSKTGHGGLPAFVGALTPDFRAEVFDRRLDKAYMDQYTARLPAALEPHKGVRFIEDSANRLRLRQLTIDDLRSASKAVADVYRVAYGLGSLTNIPEADFRLGQSLRTYVRKWITQWDLELVYGSASEIFAVELTEDLTEEAGLDTESEANLA